MRDVTTLAISLSATPEFPAAIFCDKHSHGPQRSHHQAQGRRAAIAGAQGGVAVPVRLQCARRGAAGFRRRCLRRSRTQDFYSLSHFVGAYEVIRHAVPGREIGYGTRDGLSKYIRPAVEEEAVRIF